MIKCKENFVVASSGHFFLTVAIFSPSKDAPIPSPVDIAPQPQYKSSKVTSDRWESSRDFLTSGVFVSTTSSVNDKLFMSAF